MPHSPPLDGIRGIAILAVLLFHIAPQLLPGGFAGVDVFFVLSGFLLTRCILSDIGSGRFQIGNFLLRRAMRILPNLTLMVVSVVLLWAWIFPPGATRDIARQGLWTLYCIPNLYLWTHIGTYWGQAAHWSPLTHTWSLGIEEQFYALLPVFLMALLRWRSPRITLSICLLVLASLGVWWFGMVRYPVAGFYLLPPRAWELCLGCLIASIRVQSQYTGGPPGWMAGYAAGWSGILLVVSSLLFRIEGAWSSFWNSVPAAVGCALLLSHLTSPDVSSSGLAWALGGRLIGALGRLSYSLYIWHWPLLTLGGYFAERRDLDPTVGKAAGVFASLLPAVLAYRHVELPCRRRGTPGFRRPALIATALLTTTATCGLMARMQPTDPAGQFDPPHYFARTYDAGRLFTHDWSKSTRYRGVQTPPLPDRPADAWRTGGVIRRHGGGDPTVVVLGSSHALMYASMIDSLCAELGLSVAFLCLDGGASPFFENRAGLNFDSDSLAAQFDQARLGWIQTWKPEILFVLDRWSLRASNAPDFDGKLREFLHRVAPFSRNQIFAAETPALGGIRDNNLLELIRWESRRSSEPVVFKADRQQSMRDQFAQVLERATPDFEGLRVLRPDLQLLMPQNRVHHLASRKLLYIDDNHLSNEGAELFRPLFRKAITDAIQRSRDSTPGPEWKTPDGRPSLAGEPHSSQERSWTTNWSRPR